MTCTSPKPGWAIETGIPDAPLSIVFHYPGHDVLRRLRNNRLLPPQPVDIPCRKCDACRKTRANNWTSRCLHELAISGASCVATFTYDQEHFLKNDGDLCYRDLQLLFKKMRKAGFKFRYMVAGEYGSKTFRPHFHVLFFGYRPADLVPFQGKFSSAVLMLNWGKGTVLVDNLNEAGIRYVCGYVLKETQKPEPYIVRLMTGDHKTISPKTEPFHRFSSNPALGKLYFQEYKDAILANLSVAFANRKAPVPPYYLRLLEDEDEEAYDEFIFRRDVLRQQTAALKDEEILTIAESNRLRSLQFKREGI